MDKVLGRQIEVVVVDHDSQNREFIRRSLTAAGVSATLSDSALTGLDAIGKDRPDLIILDLVLPDQDAFQLLQLGLEATGPNERGLPPILVMITNDPIMKLEIRNAGLRYLTKPFTQAELLDSMVEALQQPLSTAA
jgi:DNA-binding response OmpR family regulator